MSAQAAVQALPTAGTDPGRAAVICDNGEVLTFGELADRVSRLAGALRRRGLRPGDVVAILSENTPAYLEMIWACRIAGLYFVTVNRHLGAAEIAYILADSEASALLASANLPVHAELTAELTAGLTAELTAGLTAEQTPGVRHRLLRGGPSPGWDDYETEIATAPHYERDTELEGDILQYSSGTTGRPKGIKRRLRPAPASASGDLLTGLTGLIGIDEDSVYLCPAPLYHTAPCMWTMTTLRVGATVVLMTRFDAREALALIERHRVTHGQFVPTMFTRMLKLPERERLARDVSSLKAVVHAAAPCPAEIKRGMIGWWGPIVSEYWSSSEGAGFTFITAPEWLERPGSVGRPLLGSLHIRDEDGRDLPPGETGLIWAEGTDFTYLNAPDKDAETTSPEGWRTVGDLGRLDEDGYLYVTDRASFMIISGGVNIYPQEAENALVEHPKVYDAAVVGLPDDDLGEIAVAVVQPIDPAGAGPGLAAELTEWCASRLARYKCPRRIEFTGELPRSDTGKLYKRQLRERLLPGARG
ncbi:acyl-CoA synthetase [Actinomadura sp. 7K507]|uniref:acyl-CoA synthetase n=1 Tax=Actinomadura sp. 7K507 TaxID=2530365 RepID=UPI00104B22CF|nr:acyl-CoA synthetase [Actinomadura sp. 7K507]TDC74904.1 acyl-CoA synthetase [Actinomadura sp. 7K507]